MPLGTAGSYPAPPLAFPVEMFGVTHGKCVESDGRSPYDGRSDRERRSIKGQVGKVGLEIYLTAENNDLEGHVLGAIFGHLVGDAFGVPFEFHRSENLPVVLDWSGWGTHDQPPGNPPSFPRCGSYASISSNAPRSVVTMNSNPHCWHLNHTWRWPQVRLFMNLSLNSLSCHGCFGRVGKVIFPLRTPSMSSFTVIEPLTALCFDSILGCLASKSNSFGEFSGPNCSSSKCLRHRPREHRSHIAAFARSPKPVHHDRGMADTPSGCHGFSVVQLACM